MKYLKVAQGVVSFTAGLGISQILSGIVQTTTPTDTTYKYVTVTTAKVVVGYAIGEVIDNMLTRKTDELQLWWHENITTKAESK